MVGFIRSKLKWGVWTIAVLVIWWAAVTVHALYCYHGQINVLGFSFLTTSGLALVGLLLVIYSLFQSQMRASHLQKMNQIFLQAIPDYTFVINKKGKIIWQRTQLNHIGSMQDFGKQATLETLRSGVPFEYSDQTSTFWFRPRWISSSHERDQYILTLDDITADHIRYKRLKNWSHYIERLVFHSPIGLIKTDSYGYILNLNEKASELLSFYPSHKDMLHQQLSKWLPEIQFSPSEEGPLIKTASLHHTGSEELQITYAVLGDDEQLNHCCVLLWRHDEMNYYRRRINNLEKRIRTFFKKSPVGIALVSREGIIEEANQAFGTLVGEDLNILIGSTFCNLLHKEDRTKVRKRTQHVLEGVKSFKPIEVRFQYHRQASAALFINRLRDEDESVSKVMVQVLDITEQKSLEARFIQSQKMQAIGQLAGGIAHDFNNLLTAMIGFCDLVLTRHKPGDQTFADIMQIKQNANRGANLVRQLLAFSRQQTLQPKILSLIDVISELSHLLRRLIGVNIDLKISHERDLGLVEADQGQLEQVIVNLAVNARDAMPTGGILNIRTRNETLLDPLPTHHSHDVILPGDYVVLEIEDTGTGISEEHLVRIFEPFFSTKEVGAGTGLGLSTAYGIIQQTGGSIFVESVVGHHTLFKIYLPRFDESKGQIQNEINHLEPRRDVQDLTGHETILLVEDEDSVRTFTARALKNKGYKILEARSGIEAMGIVKKEGNHIELLVTDLVMPEMDGAALIEQARLIIPGLKTICVSGYAEDTLRDRLKENEQVRFLPKPYSLKDLAQCVREVLNAE